MLRNTDFFAKKQGFNSDKTDGEGRVFRFVCQEKGKNETGGAIVWILVAIALFAALNYAVSKGTRSGATTISKEQAVVASNEILDYGRAIRQAVQTLQINGCGDTEISFENSVVLPMANAAFAISAIL